MESAMKAMVYHVYGSPDVLELAEIAKPAVKEDHVLIKVRTASVNPHDWHFLTGTPYLARLMAGLLKPRDKVLGVDVAGRVETVGTQVTQFQPGDEVFGSNNHGGFAEYASVPAAHVALKPASMSFEQAAAIPLAALTALQCLRDHGQLESGQRVLINGASGGVGSFAVQIAKGLGAQVTGVCSTPNLDLVRSLGADAVIDYTQEDFASTGVRYDLIFDAVRKRSFADCKRALGPRGIYVTTEISPTLLLRAWRVSMTGSQKMVPMLTRPNQEDLLVISALFEAGKVVPVIDRRYTLSEIPEALRYIGKGHARGKVVINM
jgi:NADPH:quinone reductase-like Zn-dependent oxidoreductase